MQLIRFVLAEVAYTVLHNFFFYIVGRDLWKGSKCSNLTYTLFLLSSTNVCFETLLYNLIGCQKVSINKILQYLHIH